jgi:hypothetical protein
MSRYEWTNTSTPVYCLRSDELTTTGTDWALVIGDPGATALVIEGIRDDLLRLLDRATASVVATFVAEHEKAVHLNAPEIHCPLCVSEEGGRLGLLSGAP